MPSSSDLPKDELGREIALYLHDHPQIATQFEGVNLHALAVDAKLEMLARLKSALGIKPIRRRQLGYVGP